MSSCLEILVHLFELEYRRKPTDSEKQLLIERRDKVEARFKTVIQEYLENYKLHEEVDKLVEFVLAEDTNGNTE
jgi:intein-encoded DNA endonuclease-like protein